ncbi:MAG: rhomboid family intramembrane serine protease [Pseudomonadota bacterium]
MESSALEERALYMDWIKRSLQADYYIVPALVVAFGASQAFLLYLTGEPYTLVSKLGVVYGSIDKGEYWRFLTGPFLHVDFGHWIVNFISLVFFAAMMSAFPNRILHLLLMISAISGSAIAAYLRYTYTDSQTQLFDGFAGISGGVFYLQGFLLANAFRYAWWYPARTWVFLLLIVATNLTIPTLIQTNTSVLSHVFGLCIGISLGACFQPSCGRH